MRALREGVAGVGAAADATTVALRDGGAVGLQGEAGAATNVKLFPPYVAVRAFGYGDNLKIGQRKFIKHVMY